MAQQTSWEADKMLDVYIYDYLLKRNLHASAKAFMSEGKVAAEPVGMNDYSSLVICFNVLSGLCKIS